MFDGIFARSGAAAEVGDAAWLRALLDTEAALARAQAREGAVPASAARAIGAACSPARFDAAALGAAAADGGNPVIPLVRALTAAVHDIDPEAARFVHTGATSQDIMDTAAMLVVRRACGAIAAETGALGAALADLAARHRDTPMAGRTLLQQALPTTFGAVAAGWLNGIGSADTRLADVAAHRTAAQLGGAAGTLASLGPGGPAVAAAFAAELGLAEPVLPWHTDRARVAETGAALAVLCGALGKAAHDIVLLAQTEVGEVTEDAGPGVGGSSTLPHKRNPVAAVATRSCAAQAPALAAGLLGAMDAEQQRAAGAWQSEWPQLSALLRLTGAAASWLRASLDRLRVHPDRMRANLDATGGLLTAERVTAELAAEMGREAAHDAVAAACRDTGGGPGLAAALERRTGGRRDSARFAALLDPADYLGAAGVFTDRALAAHRARPAHEEGHA
ncbi:3-carboxy-cis,cis-muconate cycloisomerase [Murinocardiopsis flavida]|uniref:3-carboxy-cis,cis-muconate cycloisomerase n=1 Tax=Murinocardiopsis flavida TaxID=645275 RepID=A0A2P8DNS4_9ACTN|nr:3-carboxy-cis,cis-muconate cycloisomerase [Murinocardiopsis flavida]PSK98872.1 3-carboxy-cis,cis-muconate cycloisomerase [Murinocardiopsis flavida]